MGTYAKRIIWAGGLATLAFSIVLHLALFWNSPPFNMALWDGGFLTLNMAWATVLGMGIEWIIGALLCFGFAELWVPRIAGPFWVSGVSFGVAWWGVMMLVGLPLLGALSPLSQNGLAPTLGLFGLGEGPATPVLFLLAMAAFGLVAGYLLGQRHIWGPFRWPLG